MDRILLLGNKHQVNRLKFTSTVRSSVVHIMLYEVNAANAGDDSGAEPHYSPGEISVQEAFDHQGLPRVLAH
jgi:hypothetical protein